MFKRGNGKLVSILLPTRKRTNHLCQTIDSLYSLAKNKEDIEFLLKIDDDDFDTISVIEKISKLVPMRYYIGPRGAGYLDVYKFYNKLASMSTADWLFVFNDDARMATDNWDEILLNMNPWLVPNWSGTEDICLIGCTEPFSNANLFEPSFNFPIVRRKVYEILGRITEIAHVDYYLFEVLSKINALVISKDILVREISLSIDDSTKREGRERFDTIDLPKFLTQDVIMENIEKDIKKLTEYKKMVG